MCCAVSCQIQMNHFPYDVCGPMIVYCEDCPISTVQSNHNTTVHSTIPLATRFTVTVSPRLSRGRNSPELVIMKIGITELVIRLPNQLEVRVARPRWLSSTFFKSLPTSRTSVCTVSKLMYLFTCDAQVVVRSCRFTQ